MQGVRAFNYKRQLLATSAPLVYMRILPRPSLGFITVDKFDGPVPSDNKGVGERSKTYFNVVKNV
jgi:hypothetical protein